MTPKEWIEYLSRFPADAPITVIIVRLETREIWPVEDFGVMDPEEVDHPVAVLRLGVPENLDAIGKEQQ